MVILAISTNYLLQKSSGVGRNIWLAVGIPLQISSGAGRVTRRAAAVRLQKRSGAGRRIWLVAAVAGGLVGAVSAWVVAAAACVSAGGVRY
jgi:hypothetical protein